MSNHFIPQSDQPWRNHEYFWHEIIELTYSDEPGLLLEVTQDHRALIESVIVTTHNNDTKLTRDWCYSRQLLIDRIKSGDRFMVGDARLQVVVVNGQQFIRTNQEQIEADYAQ